MIVFNESDHSYVSVNEPDKKWTSVTTLIKKYVEPFDDVAQAKKSSKNMKSKWYNIPPKQVLDIWKRVKDEACERGTYYHNLREKELVSMNTIRNNETTYSIVKPVFTDKGLKKAPEQKLKNNTYYPEHLVYLEKEGIIGQSDKVIIENSRINISDYKTNASIDKTGFKRMLGPVGHLSDCNFNHYSLQLSCYAYMIQKHNPLLKIGKLTLEHIKFKSIGKDQYGYDIFEKDANNNYVVEDIIKYEIPYLKTEIVNIINDYTNSPWR